MKKAKEEDKIVFYDGDFLTPTEGIGERANEVYIRKELKKRFPQDVFPSLKVVHNKSGFYKGKVSLIEKVFGGGKKVTGLPEYYEIEVTHLTGEYRETLIVWTPVQWNGRFAGTAGGGTGIGGRGYLTHPMNTQRGWNLPYCVCNGFSAATMYAGNIDGWHDHLIDEESGKFNRELYENWRIRSTHNMTVFGKAITEIVQGKSILYSYFNGGSGGGRQALMEVQNYPNDYDGVWASCPAINWEKFLLAGFWPGVVMNEYNHVLSAKKNEFFLNAVMEKNGGKEKYYRLKAIPPFDFQTLVGQKVGRGRITKLDAIVMNELVDGPRTKEGKHLWYGFLPGVKNWQKYIPIGTYYYPLFEKGVRPFPLGPIVARWITENPKQDFSKMKKEEFFALFDEGLKKFSDNLADDPNIDEFFAHGGKLMIDHGIDDPLIPVEGTLDYVKKLKAHFGSSSILESSFRLYINPGDNHGNCWGNGKGITESSGMMAMMDWVEKDKAPSDLFAIRVNHRTGETLEEGYVSPYLE